MSGIGFLTNQTEAGSDRSQPESQYAVQTWCEALFVQVVDSQEYSIKVIYVPTLLWRDVLFVQVVDSEEYPIKDVYHFDVRKRHTSDLNTIYKDRGVITTRGLTD